MIASENITREILSSRHNSDFVEFLKKNIMDLNTNDENSKVLFNNSCEVLEKLCSQCYDTVTDMQQIKTIDEKALELVEILTKNIHTCLEPEFQYRLFSSIFELIIKNITL